MKITTVERYTCDLCGTQYADRDAAMRCESRPVSEDKGVRVGDRVRITLGDGAGSDAVVEHIGVHSREWGHYAWERYWHTVYVTAKVVGGWGSRQLSFDSYEVQP